MGLLMFAVGWLLGAAMIVQPVACALGVAAAAALLWIRKQRAAFVLLLLALGCGTTRAWYTVKSHEAKRAGWLAHGLGLRLCHGSGTVARSPVAIADKLRVVVESDMLECEGTAWQSGTLLLYVDRSAGELGTGDAVQFTAQLGAIERFANSAAVPAAVPEAQRGVVASGSALDVLRTSRAIGIRRAIDAVRGHVRNRINATFSSELAPLARGMMLGETDLTPTDALAFHQSGLSHLLAVSGMHLVLVIGTAEVLLRKLLLRWNRVAARWDVRRISPACMLPCLWTYAFFAGASGSAIRAAVMMSAVYVAAMSGRAANSGRALSLSIALMAIAYPLALFDLSFLLSVAATAGLLGFSAPIALGFGKLLAGRAKPLATSLGATVAATIPCLPVLASMGSRLSLGSMYLNLVAVPLGELAALPLCMLHALAAPVPWLEHWLAVAATGALACVRFLALAGASVTSAFIPPPSVAQWVLLGIGAMAWIVGYRRLQVWLLLFGALGIAEYSARETGMPTGQLRVTFVDVGQGDSALVDLPNGDALLIDGGGFVGSPVDPGTRALIPLLGARRRQHLRAVVLSHPHPDHAGGLAAVVRALAVDEAWDTGQGRSERTTGAYANFVGALDARAVRRIEAPFACGIHAIGGAVIEVLAPCPLVVGRGANDGSFVMRIRFGDRAVLFVGDAEQLEERELLRYRADCLAADVLKVGHHGSKTSTSAEFLAAVKPTYALVSSGVRNRFGHPHPRALAALNSAGVATWRTDQGGSVVFETDGTSARMRRLYAPWNPFQ